LFFDFLQAVGWAEKSQNPANLTNLRAFLGREKLKNPL